MLFLLSWTSMFGLQIFGAILTLITFRLFESRAAMRGCKQLPMPGVLSKLIRVVFLLCLLGPFAAMVDLTLFRGYPLAFGLLLLYLPSYIDLTEQTGGRKDLHARRWKVFQWIRNYFNVSVVKTVDLDPSKTYVFGVHPHAILPFGGMIGMNAEMPGLFSSIFPNIEIRVLAATFCFLVPGYRDMLLAGGVVDASRFSAKLVMSKGYSISVVPGGATEALYCTPEQDVLVLKKRTGFVRLALESGASLVPVFSFNENNTYEQLGYTSPTVSYIKKKFQSMFGISLPLVSNLLPKRTKVTVVIGKPLDLPKINEPTREECELYLGKYIHLLEELYRENAHKYNIPKEKKPLLIL